MYEEGLILDQESRVSEIERTATKKSMTPEQYAMRREHRAVHKVISDKCRDCPRPKVNQTYCRQCQDNRRGGLSLTAKIKRRLLICILGGPRCVWCGRTHPRSFHIDHVHGVNTHCTDAEYAYLLWRNANPFKGPPKKKPEEVERKRLSAAQIYDGIVNGKLDPNDYQVLCGSCNMMASDKKKKSSTLPNIEPRNWHKLKSMRAYNVWLKEYDGHEGWDDWDGVFTRDYMDPLMTYLRLRGHELDPKPVKNIADNAA